MSACLSREQDGLIAFTVLLLFSRSDIVCHSPPDCSSAKVSQVEWSSLHFFCKLIAFSTYCSSLRSKQVSSSLSLSLLSSHILLHSITPSFSLHLSTSFFSSRSLQGTRSLLLLQFQQVHSSIFSAPLNLPYCLLLSYFHSCQSDMLLHFLRSSLSFLLFILLSTSSLTDFPSLSLPHSLPSFFAFEVSS
jgi:hypothetical protein